MQGLMLHCGSNLVTREMVNQVPIPTATATWNPVPYKLAIDLVLHEADKHLGMKLVKESYGLNKKGSQLFATFTFDAGLDDEGLSIGLRQSYNKTLSMGMVAGSQVFVCDNLCFSGSSIKLVRKNTVYVWRDFERLVKSAIWEARADFDSVLDDKQCMKEYKVEQDHGYEILGKMIGHDLLKPHQSSVAFEDWNNPRHEEFTERNLWSLYNCVTEGLKKASPATRMVRQAKCHDYITGLL